MICLICRQAEVLERLTPVRFQRGKLDLVIDNVPAMICPSCGEAYVEEEVAVRLLQSAKEALNAGMLDARFEYTAV